MFCQSLSDVFDNEVDFAWRLDLFRLVLDTPNLDHLVLTKRIGNAEPMIQAVLQALCDEGRNVPAWPWKNVWLGATIVNQQEADRDIIKLLRTKAYRRFVSMKPLFGAVDLARIPTGTCGEDATLGDCCLMAYLDALTGEISCRGDDRWTVTERMPALDWVILGGETGSRARPMHPQWAIQVRDACVARGVPCFFKQWGE